MKIINIYRSLVVVSFCMMLIWLFSRDLFWGSFSAEVQRLLMVDGFGNVLSGTDKIFYAVLLVSLICYVGLFLLKKWAVWVLIILDVFVVVLLAPFSGIEISTPVERVSKTILLMSDGGIIAIAFLSEFKKIIK